MKNVMAKLDENPMFYKDITQWLRNKTFGLLFFGLLFVAEAIALAVIAGSDNDQGSGKSLFYVLYTVLMVYGVIISVYGNVLTSKEFVNRTFELYELSGMSLERMVGGKLLSLVYQFLFGFFLLVPFMFFSYFLGGLDFLEVILGPVIAILMALPLYLITIASSFNSKSKQVNIGSRLASGFFMGWFILFMMFSLGRSTSAVGWLIKQVSDAVKGALHGDLSVLLLILAIVAVYVQACLLLFYFACNSISRENDSREISIKILLTTLTISWFALLAVRLAMGSISEISMYLTGVPLFVVFLVLGMTTFYNRPAVPPIVRRRFANKGPLSQGILWLFQPGTLGSVRSTLMIVLLSVLLGSLVVNTFGAGAYHGRSWAAMFGGSSTSIDVQTQWFNIMSLLVQVPWFLVWPMILFSRSEGLSRNYSQQRGLAIALWALIGIVVMVYIGYSHSTRYSNDTNPAATALAALLSPLSSVIALANDKDYGIGVLVRMFTGVLGIFMFIAMGRAKIARYRAEHEVVDLAEAPAEPPTLPEAIQPNPAIEAEAEV